MKLVTILVNKLLVCSFLFYSCTAFLEPADGG